MIRRAVVVSLFLLAGAVFLAFASKSEPVPIRRPLTELPETLGMWETASWTPLKAEILRVLGVDDYTNRIYRNPSGATVGLYIGYYRSQREGDTMHSPLNCLPGAGWNPVKKEFLDVPIAFPASEAAGTSTDCVIRINHIVIQKGLEKQLVLYWYQSQGRVVASEYWGKIYTVLDAIRNNRTDAALVRVISPVAGLEVEAEMAAERNAVDFVNILFPLLKQYLPQ